MWGDGELAAPLRPSDTYHRSARVQCPPIIDVKNWSVYKELT